MNQQEGQERILSVNDYALSWLIAQQLRPVWGHCYQNAYPTFFAFPQYFDPDGRFIEGWIVFEDRGKVVLMEHGWLTSNGQHIIDPTIVLLAEYGQPVHYFPGVSRNGAELLALENEFFPHVHFESYGDGGMDHPNYRKAYEQAQQKARMLLTEGKTLVEVAATMPDEQPISRMTIFYLGE